MGWLLEPSLDARPECWAGSWVELPAGPAPAAKVTSGAGAGRPQGLCPAAGGARRGGLPLSNAPVLRPDTGTGGSRPIPAGSWPRNAGAWHGTATRYPSSFQTEPQFTQGGGNPRTGGNCLCSKENPTGTCCRDTSRPDMPSLRMGALSQERPRHRGTHGGPGRSSPISLHPQRAPTCPGATHLPCVGSRGLARGLSQRAEPTVQTREPLSP